jgi:hypothetical protein
MPCCLMLNVSDNVDVVLLEGFFTKKWKELVKKRPCDNGVYFREQILTFMKYML